MFEANSVDDDHGRIKTDQIGFGPHRFNARFRKHAAQIKQTLPQRVTGCVFALFSPQDGRNLAAGQEAPWIESEQSEEGAGLLTFEEQDLGGARPSHVEATEKTYEKEPGAGAVAAHEGPNLTH
jgi:hypothetical protein